MPRTRPPYAAASRRQMVDPVRAGRTPEDLARQFEPSQAIRTWVAQADRDAGTRSDGLRAEEREEASAAAPGEPAAAGRARDIGKGNGLIGSLMAGSYRLRPLTPLRCRPRIASALGQPIR